MKVKTKAALLVAALCVLALGGCGDDAQATRAKLAEVEATGRQVTQSMDTYFKKHRRFPMHIEEAYVRPRPLADIKLLSVDQKSGVVRAQLAFKPLEGKSLLFVPTRNKDRSLAWRCTSEGIDPKLLPDTCK